MLDLLEVSSRLPTVSAKTYAAERLQLSNLAPARPTGKPITPPSQTAVAWKPKRAWHVYTGILTPTQLATHKMPPVARPSPTRGPWEVVTRPERVPGRATSEMTITALTDMTAACTVGSEEGPVDTGPMTGMARPILKIWNTNNPRSTKTRGWVLIRVGQLAYLP